MKQAQVRARLTDVRAHVAQTLKPYFHPYGFGAKARRAHSHLPNRVISEFDECLERQKFGSFLRGLCLDRERSCRRALTKPARAGITEDADQATPSAMPKPRPGGGLLAAIKGGAGPAERPGSRRPCRRPHHVPIAGIFWCAVPCRSGHAACTRRSRTAPLPPASACLARHCEK